MEIGHNNPPEIIELASGVAKDLSKWMADNPVIETEEAAKDAKLQIDRAKLCLKDLEDDKNKKTKPLSERIKRIKDEYFGPVITMESILTELSYRLQGFVFKEEERRREEAKKLAEEAEKARLAAIEAEQKEKARLDDAAQGEVGVDVVELIENANAAFDEYTRAKRAALRAENETHVKIAGGFSRAIGLRSKKTLVVAGTMQAICAIEEMGLTKDIEAAILKSARAYEKINGKLPNGVTALVEKSL